jgi:HEAT repeat protein
MASAPLVDKIRALLGSEAHERQIAAAIVLGEIGARDAKVIDALADAATVGIPPVQRHALEALGRLAGGKTAGRTLGKVLPCLASRDPDVRRAAVDAAIAFGDPAVAAVRARLADSTDVLERRALEEVLGRVGGKDAFSALLGALDTTDLEAARAAALAVRQRIKEASAREKAAYLTGVTKLLGARGKRGPSAALVAGGLKILGYLEDPSAIPTLLAFARDRRQPAPVREEAIVALRFTARGNAGGAAARRTSGARVVGTLAELAERAEPALARAALYSMASLEIPPALAARLGKLALGPEAERGLLALERLAQIAGGAGGDALARVLTATGDRMRAEAAATALAARPDGALAIARALLGAPDGERAALLARLLRPRAGTLAAGGAPGKKLARALVADALARIGRDAAAAEALLPLARELDRKATAAGLRALAAKLRKRDPARALAVLRLIGRAGDATADDGYVLGAAELAAGHRDEAMTIVRQLLDRGFDLAAALRKDRDLTPEQRYQIGFHLVEERHAAGEEVLADLAGSGRGKIAKMAKAKLKSAGYG